MALGLAAQKCAWLSRNLKLAIGEDTETIPLFLDNQRSIKLANIDIGGNWTKHIDIKFHLLRDHLGENWCTLKFCTTFDMVADILTKTLDKNHFTKFDPKMGIDSFPRLSDGK